MSVKSVIAALASVIEADGKVHPDEQSELVRFAGAEGLNVEARSIDTAALEPSERSFVYAFAYWLSRVDGEMSDAEDAVLSKIGKQLELADDKRMAAEALVDELVAAHAKLDLTALRRRLD